jgi:hypothetical protein
MSKRMMLSAMAVLLAGGAVFVPSLVSAQKACACSANCNNGSCSCSAQDGKCSCYCVVLLGTPSCSCGN